MDPIITALIAGATAGLTKIGSQLVADSYHAIKTAISQKFGAQSDALQALDKLESKPDSEARKNVVVEELAGLDIHRDNELIELAQKLIDALNSSPDGAQHINNIQKVIGNDNVVVGSGSTVSINRDK